MRSQGNAENARIEGINELMLQAKVPENHDRLEIVPKALDLTKSLRHLAHCVSRSNCPQLPPCAISPHSRTNYLNPTTLHRNEVPPCSEASHLGEVPHQVVTPFMTLGLAMPLVSAS
jgi:hypothetical protein